MKEALVAFLLVVYGFRFNNVNAQTLNWKGLGDTQHIMNANFGLDHSLSYGVGYGYRLNTKLPIVFGANLSLPFGEHTFDDFKTKIGGQICLLNSSSFVGVISISGVYRKYQTDFARLQNFGSDVKGTFGYYKQKWFVTAEIGFDKAIVTHFKHSQKFRDEVYAEVVDGWYEPATGGNFYFGLSAGYSLKKADITLNLGRVISQDFKTPPLLPFYLNLGFNYRF